MFIIFFVCVCVIASGHVPVKNVLLEVGPIGKQTGKAKRQLKLGDENGKVVSVKAVPAVGDVFIGSDSGGKS